MTQRLYSSCPTNETFYFFSASDREQHGEYCCVDMWASVQTRVERADKPPTNTCNPLSQGQLRSKFEELAMDFTKKYGSRNIIVNHRWEIRHRERPDRTLRRTYMIVPIVEYNGAADLAQQRNGFDAIKKGSRRGSSRRRNAPEPLPFIWGWRGNSRRADWLEP